MRPVPIILATCLAGLLLGCGSGRGASSYLYEQDGGEARLRDSEIRMETERYRQGGPGPDVRSIRCKDGRITARYESPARRQAGEAEIPLATYSKIWAEVMERAGWGAKPEVPDPQGGFYHFIRFRLGTRVGETSAQDRSNFLGVGTQNIRERLELANAITDLIAEHVVVGPMKEAPDPAPGR